MTEPLNTEQNSVQVTGKRAVSVVAAEGTGIAVSLGALMLVKKTLGEDRLDRGKDWVGTHIILPILRRSDAGKKKIEHSKTLDKVMNEETEKAVFDNKFFEPALTVEERARKYAETLVDISVMLPLGMLARLGVQRELDKRQGVLAGESKNYVFASVADNAVGAMTLLGMNTLAKEPTKKTSDTVAKVFHKLGLSEKTADSLAKYTVYLQVPNMMGMAAKVAALNHVSRHEEAPARV